MLIPTLHRKYPVSMHKNSKGAEVEGNSYAEEGNQSLRMSPCSFKHTHTHTHVYPYTHKNIIYNLLSESVTEWMWIGSRILETGLIKVMAGRKVRYAVIKGSVRRRHPQASAGS